MGSGDTAYRITKGQTRGLIERETQMIPVYEARAASELGIRKLAFEQELQQAEKLGLLSQKLSPQSQPIFAPPPVREGDHEEKPNFTILIALGIVAVLYFKKGKLL